jgi:hypothetical protein
MRPRSAENHGGFLVERTAAVMQVSKGDCHIEGIQCPAIYFLEVPYPLYQVGRTLPIF